MLQKTTYAAPFDGMITNLPVREGETVVIGIQNSPGSTLMTIAEMSVLTAEVKVDETDIVNVRLGQPAEISIDAMPKRPFKAVVSEIGNNAIVRSQVYRLRNKQAPARKPKTSKSSSHYKIHLTIFALVSPPPPRSPLLPEAMR